MENKLTYYRRVLSSAKAYRFLTPGEKVIAENSKLDPVFLRSTALVTAPSLTAYVIWILSDAVTRNIRALYFLARDGLVLCNIARTLCRDWGLDIACRYLYCSRIALRLPLFDIDRDYAMDKLCAPTYKACLGDILARANIVGEQSKEVADETGVGLSEPLKKDRLLEIKGRLARSGSFGRMAALHAKAAYRNVSGYLRQEFAGASHYALVDTGWEGSMQACLSMLLHNALGTPRTSMAGYYLGMYKPGNPQFGSTRCFLFRNARKLLSLRGFSNNLAECLCAADHGMTTGYKQTGGQWFPVLADPEQGRCPSAWDAGSQARLCGAYARHFTGVNASLNRSDTARELAATAGRLLRSLMARPTPEEARLYGAIPFSDGMSSDIQTVLAAGMTGDQLRYKSFSYRAAERLMGRGGIDAPDQPVYWLSGALALSGCGALRRLDARLLDALYWVLHT